MTSEPAAFKWIEIEGFRAFNERQRIDLNSSAVVIVGPNGMGKTSFFDAIQWLLLGSIGRLDQWKVRKNDDPIGNRFRGDDVAIVEAQLEIRDVLVTLRRQGRYDAGFLEWRSDDDHLVGEEAQSALNSLLAPRPGQDMKRMLMTSALLQQDVIRDVLEDKPAQRYEHLATLLGLDDVSTFESVARARADRLAATARSARADVENAEMNLRSLATRMAEAEASLALEEDVSRARDAIGERIQRYQEIISVDDVPRTAADAAVLQRTIGVLGESLTELMRLRVDIDERKAKLADLPDGEFEEAQKSVAAAIARHQVAAKKIEEIERDLASTKEHSSRLTSLAIEALDLLGPCCPVCAQDIDEATVAQRLREQIASGSTAAVAAVTETLQGLRQELETASDEVRVSQGHLQPLLELRQSWTELATDETRWATACEEFEAPSGSGVGIKNLAAIRLGEVAEIHAARDALRSLWSAMADLVAALRTDQSSTSLAALRAATHAAEDKVASAKETATLASSQEEKGRTLQRAATRAVAAVASKRFRELQPTVQDIYSRLDPHPVFKTLDFALDVFRQKAIASPIARDEAENVDADPLLVFSSSQANATALSYFLALGWAAGAGALPFVMLDDPLQSMDDVNALGFADLCRHVRRDRQLLVSTHDRRLASLLERKLAARATNESARLIEFEAWSRRGPEITQRTIDSEVMEGQLRAVVSSEAA